MSTILHAIRATTTNYRNCMVNIESINRIDTIPGSQGTTIIYHDRVEFEHLLRIARIGKVLSRHACQLVVVRSVAQIFNAQGGGIFDVLAKNGIIVGGQCCISGYVRDARKGG